MPTLETTLAKLRERRAVPCQSNHQLPLWPKTKRGVPNHFLRSALFTATKGIDVKDPMRDVVIFSQGNIEIKYTGQRLCQSHLNVYESVMQLAREQEVSKEIQFTAHGLLKLMGRSTGGKDVKRLLLALNDLTATSVQVKDKKNGKLYWGSLLPDGNYDDDSGVCSVSINERLARLYKSGYTQLEQHDRRALARSPLASFLQGWILSHDKALYPVSVSYLNKLSGSNTKRLRDFKVKLKTALKRLKDEGIIEEWAIDKDDLMIAKKTR